MEAWFITKVALYSAVSFTLKDPWSDPRLEVIKVGVDVSVSELPLTVKSSSSRVTDARLRLPVFSTIIV